MFFLDLLFSLILPIIIYTASCMEILYQYCGFTLDENPNIFCVIKKMLLFLPKKNKKQPNPQEGWKTTHLSWKGC